MTPNVKTSVKALAEFVHRSGDLYLRSQSTTLAQEGIATQRRWQEGRGESYRREHRVAATFGALEVTGRIDGWDPSAALVEEVKTTRTDVDALHRHVGGEHLAQLRLYGALLVLGAEATGELKLRLSYLHPQDAVPPRAFDECWRDADLVAYFEATCSLYVAWLEAMARRLEARRAELRRLRFPYASFHAHQRRIAKHVYRGLRDDAHRLVEAPTGAGKTMACLFPALKAMGEGALDRVIFLTARSTGQEAAERALEAVAGEALTTVTVTAKERICFNPGTPCDADLCQFARGYHDRAPAARRELLDRGRCVREDVEEVARRFEVCPFELSLETAAWADVVVGDYNYVFDPLVRLKRLTTAPLPGPRAGLVIDEAHQLGERVRDMLGATLERSAVKAALGEAGLHESLRARLRSVDRALGSLASAARSASDADAAANALTLEVPPPEALRRAIERFAAILPTLPMDVAATPAAKDAAWQLLGFLRGMERATNDAKGDGREDGKESGKARTLEDGGSEKDDAGGVAGTRAFHYLASGAGRNFRIEVVCTLPAEHIRATMASFHGTVRMSGTLTPPGVFQQLHGFEEDSEFLHAANGTADDHLALFVVPDVSTYYRSRQDTLPALLALIAAVCAATPGNCLVAFPSFEYLDSAAELATEQGLAGSSNSIAAGGVGEPWRSQRPGMDLAEREDFIRWLDQPGTRRVGLVVAGGVFAESIDFDGEALRTVVVVGAGLPPRSLKRDLIASDSGRDGDEIAYRQPAMARVAQAVGRIARGNHPGLAVLVDPRFASPAYRAFFPTRWRPRTLPAKAAGAAAEAFWSSDGARQSHRGRQSGPLPAPPVV